MGRCRFQPCSLRLRLKITHRLAAHEKNEVFLRFPKVYPRSYVFEAQSECSNRPSPSQLGILWIMVAQMPRMGQFRDVLIR